jgi:hypothetical protein
MRAIRVVVAGMLGVGGLLLDCVCGARAVDIDGVWASQATACSKVFVKRRGKIAIARDSDSFGSGFIIEGNRIMGKIVSCTIKIRKEDGPVVHMVAICSTDTALQNVQFSMKSEQKDRLIRMYPGIPELDTPYFRCSL